MAEFFLDSSAIVKRYVNEHGSAYVDGLVDPEHQNNVLLAQITQVEVASAFARRNKSKTLSDADALSSLESFRLDLADIYLSVEITADLIASATDLATKHALRGFDAVQLATAVAANYDLIDNSRNPLVFVSADSDLNLAAIAEGLDVENPNDHP
jgi:uncharacterized protein